MKRKGFTLVELIVVLLIIGIISVIAVPNINSFRTNLKDKAHNKKIALIKLSAENYVLDNKNKILEACKTGTDTACFSCGTDCYNVRVGINDLVSSGSIKDERDSGGSCIVSSPLYNDCLDDWEVSVKVSGKNYTNVVSQNINVTKTNIKVVDQMKKLAKSNIENPGREDVLESESKDASCTNTLSYDGTEDNNLRYIGGHPCNYVSFNNELWRIIGAMNNIEDGTGKKETRAKIIRNDSLGRFRYYKGAVNINDWTKSVLMKELNGDYLNYNLTADTTWYYNNPFDHTKTLKANAQKLIDNAKWNLGAIDRINASIDEAYEMERGNVVWGSLEGQECNDGACPRATQWVGKVGLIYPTDFKLAPIGRYSRKECVTINLNVSSGNCEFEYNYMPNDMFWSITPSLSKFKVMNISGYVMPEDVSINSSVYPAVYLKNNVNIIAGSGSETDPYILSQ